VKKIGEVLPLFKWRVLLALIAEDSGGCGTRLACQEGYCRVPRWILTTRCHGYIISDKSDGGQDASSPVEMGNTN